MKEKQELKELLRFRDECAAKGQTLSKPKFERLTELLLTQLEAGKKLDVNETR